MSIPAATLERMQNLHEDQVTVVMHLIDYYTQSPTEIFESICAEGLENPMTEEEIDAIIDDVRAGRA